MAQTPIPTRAAVRDLLSDLVGLPVSVAEAAQQQLDGTRPAHGAVYRRDDGAVAAVCVLDPDLATAVGAGLGAVAAHDAVTPAPGVPEGDLEEFLREVVNVLTKLLNGPGSPHVVLRELRRLPGPVPADEAAVVVNPRDRADYRVRIEGYPHGTLTFVAV